MESDETPHECPHPLSVGDESPAPARRHGSDPECAYQTFLGATWLAREVRDIGYDPRQDFPQEHGQAELDTSTEGPDVDADDEAKASSVTWMPSHPGGPATIGTDAPVWELVDGRDPRRPPALTVARQPAASPRSWSR